MSALRFDVFTLDLARCNLRRDADELPLRPKAFDVLRHLAQNAGRVVSKEELFDAVWAGAARTDDSLAKCIKDIRRALGDDDHRIIKTVPKRGYLFDVAVSGHAADMSEAGTLRAFNIVQVASAQLPPQLVPVVFPIQDAAPERRWWPRVQSLIHATRLRVASAGWRGLACLAAGTLLVAVTAWNLRTPVASAAAHYTTLANAITDKERSPKARSEALALYDKALALDPDFVPALIGSAHAIIVEAIEQSMPAADRAVRLAQAEVAILRAIKLEPSNGRAHRWHGILLRARGEPERAIPALERAVALTPNSGWVHADLGRAKIEAGRADEAIGDYETALRLSPADPLAFIWCFQAGMAAVHLGHSEVALQWFLKSEQANPAYLRHIQPWRAIAHAELGHENEARALVAQHVANSPGLTLARWNEYYPRRNAIVAAQRERIAAILLRLGLPERA